MTTKTDLKTSPQRQSSFVAGTLVHTDKGLIPIQDIKVGDMVLSRAEWDGKYGQTEYKKVSRAFCSGEDTIYRVLYLDNSQTIVDGDKPKVNCLFVSENHPIWIEEVNEWVPVANLNVYEQALSSLDSNKSYTVISVYPVFLQEQNIQADSNKEPIKIGFCMQEDVAPDADMMIIDSVDGIYIHSIDLWSNMYDIESDYPSLGTDDALRLYGNGSDSFNHFTTNVYNLEIEDFHTYFVGREGIWVHAVTKHH